MLDKILVLDVLDEALKTGGEFAEVFFEDKITNSLLMGNHKIESSAFDITCGVGIRVTKGFFYAYVSTNDLTRDGLLKAAHKAAQAIKSEKRNVQINFVEEKFKTVHPVLLNPLDVSKQEKKEYLSVLSQKAYAKSDKIKRIEASVLDKTQKVLIANSEGLWVEDKRTYTALSLSATVDNGQEVYEDFSRKGAMKGFEQVKNIDLEAFAEEVVSGAVEQFSAVNCPAGKMPVVISNNGGVLFHEACGHSLEATSVAIGASVFAGKKGQKIASDKVTLVDDGTIPSAWGSLNVDDEGVKTRRNTLIKDGELVGYLVDRFNGQRMNEQPTGSSRRQDYTFAPTSRMNNTYVLSGTSDPQEIVASVKKGLYITKFGGGSVQPATGDFNFTVYKAYVIENGKVGKPVKGAKLIGNSADVLMNIDMVGNDEKVSGTGMCGSASGSVPVCHGMPTLHISSITVGGQK
ncbi:MAG: TldD/PmbA family protein [Alphaproteobacteria bacterium]|nr:TldD/PmbA family protein [Alphaproteobacteria bacterium]